MPRLRRVIPNLPNEKIFEVVNERFMEAKRTFQKLKEKSKVDLVELKTFEAFIE